MADHGGIVMACICPTRRGQWGGESVRGEDGGPPWRVAPDENANTIRVENDAVSLVGVRVVGGRDYSARHRSCWRSA